VTARLVIANAIAAREKAEDRNSNLWIAIISGIAGALFTALLSLLAKVGKAAPLADANGARSDT
jgi:hypothetical protein